MVFSSVPVYLDPPNWHHHQQPNQQQGSGGGGAANENPQLPPLPPPHVSGGGSGGGSGNGSIRPGSMADRARLAKIPQPEAALKCPRCESTNTKFCYFNNYSLSQPRHFCKTCRRYWTRGGALRNVPVGGGCRRNKKTKSHSNSKSPVSNNERQMSSTSASTTPIPSDIITHLPPQPNHQLPFMTSLHNLANHHHFGVGNVGLNFGAMATATTSNEQNEMGFHNHQIGSNSSGGVVQQFPFFEAPILPTSLLFPFQSEGVLVEAPSTSSSSRVNSQMAPVKMEDNNQGLNLLSSSKPFMGISESNNQFWSGNTWTDLSGLNSSSTTHLL